MARTAVYIHATVQPGQRINIPAPHGLREGDAVDVVLLSGESSVSPASHPSLAEILDSLPSGTGMFNSAKDVDDYVREERNSWD